MIKIKSRKSNQKNFFHFQQDFELFHLQFLTPLMKVELVAVVKPQMIFHQYSSHNNFGYFHRIYIHGLSSTNFVMTMQKDGRKMALLDIRMQRHGNKCVNKKKNSFKLRPSLYILYFDPEDLYLVIYTQSRALNRRQFIFLS